jgi:solute carrier family 13 (sodium-dependent dicarboxylate transporter), member 2/3/5
MALKRTRLKSELPQTATWGIPTKRRGESTPPTSDQTTRVGVGSTTAARSTPLTTTSKRRLQRRIIPLEILQQPFQMSVRKVFDLRRFLVVIGLTIGVLFLPQPPGLSDEGHRAIALFVFTGAILALLVPICQVALGIDDISGAFAAFSQPSVFLILASLFLAEALRKHGLTRRLALYAIVSSGGKPHLLLLSIMLITAFLSMWVQNTATTAVLIPVAITIAQHVSQAEAARRLTTILIMGIAYGSSIGGIATIVGSGENAIASGFLNQISPFGFWDWMQYGLPVVIILLPVSWLLMCWLMRLPQVLIDTKPAQAEIQRSGQFTSSEREILLVLGVCVVLWLSGSVIERLLGLPATLLSSVVVAIGAVALLSIDEVIDWNDVRGVNWGVFLVIGSGFTLGDALDKTGANEWFSTMLAPTLSSLPFGLVLLLVILIGFVITQLINDVTLGAIFSPILVSMALATGIPPARLVIPTIIAIGLAYMFPSASARMTLVAVTGAVERREMLRIGFLVGVPSVLLVYLFFYVLTLLGLI